MNKENRWFKGSRDRGLTNLKYKNKTLIEKAPQIMQLIKSKNIDEIAS
tara:strand:+ start:187 stop:330 length:144 start_codon:yes stop_codon:yes gene_type:complete